MTQQDIINELNRIVVGYNITWDYIKYDADRAIMKINAHLGAEYPKMSEIMLSPEHRYTLRWNGRDVPIFPERYILTVVIPFIATEVLARDEEFTTIYNKYAMDFDNGLFDMFQNEYHKVPAVFRQDDDVGVFFDPKISAPKINSQVPDFKFNVYYHTNTDYNFIEMFTADHNKYPYGSSIYVQDSTVKQFINGLYAYKFIGWTLSPNDTVTYNLGSMVGPVRSDVHLYARWEKDCILNVNNGTVTVKEEYAPLITHLVIPSYVEGHYIRKIGTDCIKGCTNLKYIGLPSNDGLFIETNAICISTDTIWDLVVKLPQYNYLTEKPNITIESEGISHISYIYLPYSVRDIGYYGVHYVTTVDCEITERPSTWDESGISNAVKINWGVANG